MMTWNTRLHGRCVFHDAYLVLFAAASEPHDDACADAVKRLPPTPIKVKLQLTRTAILDRRGEASVSVQLPVSLM